MVSEPLRIDRLTGPDVASLVEPLFREYGNWVLGRLQDDLGLPLDEADLERHHEEFRAELPKLVGPGGRLLLARAGEEALGVAALKPVGGATAEIKRMYVRPQARGRGVGRALLQRLVDDARGEGYRTARLESLPFMTEAHALYRSFGFVDTAIFDGSEAAMSGLEDVTYYMELSL
ncbi:MAG TPA: GNAT family N-acetyltransferase [Acidimicrobiia bacterium]|jgi:GNAT superfamily N-acetyltransferase